MSSLPRILVITGAMAAGKSTIAQGLAERTDPSVHLRGDMFRRMIVSGRITPDRGNMGKAEAQLRMRYEIAAAAALRYAAAGFRVFYQDTILGLHLNTVCDLLRPDVGVVVLRPSVAVLAERDAGRAKTGYGSWTPEDLDEVLEQQTPRLGLWLDTSALSVSETIEAIFVQSASTRLA